MESCPIEITAAAKAHIDKMLAKKPNACGFRLAIKKTGCSGYSYVPAIIDTVIADDLYFMTNENLAIYIDKASVEHLQGVTIDYREEAIDGTGLKQKHLVYLNPKEKGRCGCGGSFTV